MATETIERPDLDEWSDTKTDERPDADATDRGDDDRPKFFHYVKKEKILESAMSGEPVTALCGKIWVPGRNPDRFPVCPVCKEIYDGLRAPQDGGK